MKAEFHSTETTPGLSEDQTGKKNKKDKGGTSFLIQTDGTLVVRARMDGNE